MPLPPPSADTRRPTLAADLGASVVVFLVALPLCLGIALASGAPLMSGLIAGIIGGLLVAPLSGSQLMVSGPAAGLTAIVLAAIAELGSFPAFLTAVVLGGVLQLLFGVLKAGRVASYFPSAVIRGMLSAIGLILILKQLPHMVGYDADAMGDEAFRQLDGETTFSALGRMLEAIEPLAAVISVLGLVVLVLWPKVARGPLAVLPGALAAVVLGVVANAVAAGGAPDLVLGATHLVSLPTPATLDEALAGFTFPDWSRVADPVVLKVAVTLAIVASLETLLSLEATDRLDPAKRISPPNRELVAQGVGNAVSGLVGGLPLTGVIVRSAANIGAGARTRLSAIVHGVLLLVAVALVPALLNTIPIAALAVILVHTGYKLASPAVARTIWAQGRDATLMYGATVLAILLTDLLVGIGVGLLVAAAIILAEHLRTPGFRVVSPPGAVLRRVELDAQVTFLAKARLLAMLDALPTGSRIEIDGRACRQLDRDVQEALHEYAGTAAERGLDYRLVGIPDLAGPTAGGH